MSFKTKILTLILFIGFNFSCEKEHCDGASCCGGLPAVNYFNIIGLKANLFGFGGQLKENDSESANHLELLFDFQLDYHSHNSPNKGFISIGTPSYACSPNWGGSGSKTEMFEEVTIISIYDYNKNFSAFDTINELLDLSLGGQIDPITHYFENLLDKRAFGPYPILEKPDFEGAHSYKPFQLKLIIKLNNGEKYEALSPLVSLF